MKQNGAMFVCDNCKKQVFAEKFDDGKYDDKPLEGWSLSYGGIRSMVDLCPDCSNAFKKIPTIEEIQNAAKRWL